MSRGIQSKHVQSRVNEIDILGEIRLDFSAILIEILRNEMIIEDPYKIKFAKLSPWVNSIFQSVKKDLRNDHLLKTPSFAQKHFPKRALDKLTIEEFAAAYLSEIAEGDEELGEKVVARWIMKNAELYQFFVVELSKINPKYDEITAISDEISKLLLNSAIQQFGASATYTFCILNAVVFTEVQLSKLRELALAEKAEESVIEERKAFQSVEMVKEYYEKEMHKLLEKYEKRLQGVERKYIQDVEGLKKQISQLHKKIAEKPLGIG